MKFVNTAEKDNIHGKLPYDCHLFSN